MEGERRDTCFRIHHESFSQLHTQVLLRLEQSPDHFLAGEVGTGGIPEREALSTVARPVQIEICNSSGIREAPAGPDLSVNKFCQTFGHFNGKSLHRVRLQVLSGVHPCTGLFPYL